MSKNALPVGKTTERWLYLTAALVDGGQLSREDLAELRDYLDHLEVE